MSKWIIAGMVLTTSESDFPILDFLFARMRGVVWM